ncbi:MAG: hypothetical protein EOP73_17110 [Variovorax sp.]|jgi:hypothetical protein|nr:MAG: hypothetical protein EOP73_17110 [Variovorax sp.]
MIRADWATPPDGDFARYVDQLMARAAQARLQASATPVEGFDGGSRGASAQAVDPPVRRAGVSDGTPGPARVESRVALADALARGLRRWASPADAKGWSGWLQERVRAAADATTAPTAKDGSSRLYDPRIDRPPRKQ